MNAKKLFFGLVGILILLALAVGGCVVYGNKFLTTQNEKLTNLKVESSNLELVQTSLSAAKKDIDLYSPIEQIAKTVVPQEKDQARTVREIVKIADESGISIASITFPSSTLGNTVKGSAAPSTSANTAVSATTQTQKVEGLSNVEKLPITVTSETSKPVAYNSFLLFLRKLEQNRRTAQVENINIQPNTANRNYLTFTLVLNVYIKK
jgi:hypothetical protein